MATSSTAPAYRAPPGWNAPNALGPFPGDVRSYVCHHFELRSNRSSVAPAGRACRPCSDRLFAVVRHLASKRGALRLGVVRHVESGRRSDGLCAWRTTSRVVRLLLQLLPCFTPVETPES